MWLDRGKLPLPRLRRWWRPDEGRGEGGGRGGEQSADSKIGRLPCPASTQLWISPSSTLACLHSHNMHYLIHFIKSHTRITGVKSEVKQGRHHQSILPCLASPPLLPPASLPSPQALHHPSMTSARRVPPLLPVLVLSLALLLLLPTITLAFVLPLRSSSSAIVGLRRPHAAGGPRGADRLANLGYETSD